MSETENPPLPTPELPGSEVKSDTSVDAPSPSEIVPATVQRRRATKGRGTKPSQGKPGRLMQKISKRSPGSFRKKRTGKRAQRKRGTKR